MSTDKAFNLSGMMFGLQISANLTGSFEKQTDSEKNQNVKLWYDT
jgi:hypothetical protein